MFLFSISDFRSCRRLSLFPSVFLSVRFVQQSNIVTLSTPHIFSCFFPHTMDRYIRIVAPFCWSRPLALFPCEAEEGVLRGEKGGGQEQQEV